MLLILLVLAAVLGWSAYRSGEQAREATKEAIKAAEQAKKQELGANYNLAKVFEEKALKALENGKETRSPRDFQTAWVYATAAASLEVPEDRRGLTAATVGRFLDPQPITMAFPERWASPTLNLGASVYAVAFSPGGKTLAAASADRTVRLWDPATGALPRTLGGHTEPVIGVAFGPGGKTLASTSFDKTVRL